MSNFRQGRYSWLIKPISYAVDLGVLQLISLFYLSQTFRLSLVFTLSFGWIVTALISKFYEVYRHSSVVRVFNLLVRQGLFFSMFVFAYAGIFPKTEMDPKQILKYLISSLFFIAVFKYILFYLLKRYRAYFKGNIRRTIILGTNKQAKAIAKFFKDTPELGFINTKMVSFKKPRQEDLNTLFKYIKAHEVDEIYCSLSEISKADLKAITKFADNNLKVLKFIPEQNTILNKDLKRDFYGLVPVLEFRTIPLDDSFNLAFKRDFDVVFSILVIGFIMS